LQKLETTGQQTIMTLKTLAICAASAVALTLTPQAQAILFTGTSGDRSASADFTQAGNTLTIKLSNLSAVDVGDPTDILTAFYFNLAGGTVLNPNSAINGPLGGINGGPAAGANVGDEWQYLAGINVQGATRGISSTGLGIFGSGNFDGVGNNVNGLSYGIVSASSVTGDGNGGVDGNPLSRGSVTFTLTFTGGPLNLNNISGVVFQYGTALTEPTVPGRPPGDTVPDGGATVALLGLGLVALGASRRLIKG
jgi:hypothetical protein